MRYSIFLIIALGSLLSCVGGALRPQRAGEGTQSVQTKSAEDPVQYTYRVVRVFPHNPMSYTQGLYFDDDHLMESTGQWGESALKRVELSSGKVLENKSLSKEYFGEGVARVGNKIYQLTWTTQKAFVYDAKTLARVGEFTFSGEGWGLASDSTRLYMSDGTNRIFVLNSDTFERERVIEVTSGNHRVELLNEMEWVEGELWANVYMSDMIVRINPQTGKVTGIIDLDALLPAADRTPSTDVLNGIAYDKVQKRIYVTGKNWNKLFEIELIEKEQ